MGDDVDRNAVVMADAQGVIRYWSPGAEAAFGYPAAQAVGATLELIVPQEYRAAHWAGFRRAVAAGSAEAENDPGPFPVQRADGVVAETLGRLQLVRRPQGQVIAALVVFD
jgi:PAS domain S-box-containing protein